MCPVLRTFWDRFGGVILLLISIAGFALVTYTAILVIVRVAGGTVVGGVRHVVSLTVWSITTAQVLSQVAHVASPELPPLLAALYRAVSVLQVCQAKHG